MVFACLVSVRLRETADVLALRVGYGVFRSLTEKYEGRLAAAEEDHRVEREKLRNRCSELEAQEELLSSRIVALTADLVRSLSCAVLSYPR